MSEPTKQISFAVDQDVFDLIQDLKKELGAKTAAAVFRKSLAIAKVAVDKAKDSDGIITMRGHQQSGADEISIALKA
jgi:hypothetical protein